VGAVRLRAHPGFGPSAGALRTARVRRLGFFEAEFHYAGICALQLPEEIYTSLGGRTMSYRNLPSEEKSGAKMGTDPKWHLGLSYPLTRPVASVSYPCRDNAQTDDLSPNHP